MFFSKSVWSDVNFLNFGWLSAVVSNRVSLRITKLVYDIRTNQCPQSKLWMLMTKEPSKINHDLPLPQRWYALPLPCFLLIAAVHTDNTYRCIKSWGHQHVLGVISYCNFWTGYAGMDWGKKMRIIFKYFRVSFEIYYGRCIAIICTVTTYFSLR